jgi:hypothetical protein
MLEWLGEVEAHTLTRVSIALTFKIREFEESCHAIMWLNCFYFKITKFEESHSCVAICESMALNLK